MQTLAETLDGRADIFAATQWSVVLAAGESQVDANASRDALARLCETYWPPLYAYARGRGHSTHNAEDLTQGFFAYLIEHKIYKRIDRAKGKFRSFLLASFKNFLSDAGDRKRTLKRGGGREFLLLDEGKAKASESLFQTYDASGISEPAADRVFERSWADTVVATALQQVAAAYKKEGREAIFRDLQSFLTAGATPLPTYAELTARLATSESTLRSHVTRLRARYREALRNEVRRTVNSETEVDAELRELLRVLTSL